MSIHNDLNELTEKYRNSTTEELLRVVNSIEEYRPDVVELARQELANRGLEQKKINTIVREIEEESISKKQLAEVPLGIGLKIVCFIWCGLPGIIIAVYQRSHGRLRCSREAWSWVGYGWLFRVGLLLVMKLIGTK